MARPLVGELPAGCPWSGFTPPNVDWCEEELCAWVTNPADTWSNVAYLVFGIWMWRRARRDPASGLRLFGPTSIATGIFSGVYHASYTWFLQFFDFVGMFLFCFVVLVQNALRLGWIAPTRKYAWYAGGVALSSAAVPPAFEIGFPIQALVFLLIVAMLGQELALWRRAGSGADYRPYAVALVLIAAAAICSALDVSRVWCDPTNHWLQGHAAWHVLSAASLFALFLFYEGLSAAPQSEET